MRRVRLVVVAVGLLLTATPADASNDPGFKDQWGLATIGAEEAWNRGGKGAGVTVAVIDTGADYDHEDLAGRLVPGRNFVTATATAQDDNGHGTHVAGIVGAATDNGRGVAGTAPAAKILPLKVLDASGGGDVDDVNAAIDFAVASGAQVINLSLGPETAVHGLLLGSGFEDAINRAWEAGVICVIAAGNESTPVGYYSNINGIVVTATTRHDTEPIYANGVGSARWGLAAPGGLGSGTAADDIVSTYWVEGRRNQYAAAAGTSMAAPFVAGAAAVLRAFGLTPQQTIDRLLSTAKDLGPSGRDTTYGHGRLDLGRAAAGLGAVTATTTTSSTMVTTRATSATTAGSVRRPTTAPPTTTTTAQPTPTSAVSAPPPATEPDEHGEGEVAAPSTGRFRPVTVGADGADRPWTAASAAALLLAAAAGATAWTARRRAPTTRQ